SGRNAFPAIGPVVPENGVIPLIAIAGFPTSHSGSFESELGNEIHHAAVDHEVGAGSLEYEKPVEDAVGFIGNLHSVSRSSPQLRLDSYRSVGRHGHYGVIRTLADHLLIKGFFSLLVSADDQPIFFRK